MADSTESLPAVVTGSDAAITAGVERSFGEPTTTSGAESTTMIEQLEIEEPSHVNDAAEDESSYPTGRKFRLIVISLGLVLIMQGLDASIVSVAVPTLTEHFHSISDIGWYSAAYRLCLCSFQFMFGRLYKLFNVKPIFLASIAIALLGSTLSATATTSASFIVGRAVCGFACAGIVAGAFTMLRMCMPLRKRAMYAGIFGGVECLSTIGAPMLGGVLVEKLSWRWCFWINLPLGFVTFVVVALCLQDLRTTSTLTFKQKLKELDLTGTLLFFPAITSLFLALTWAGNRYPWDSAPVIALFCAFGVLLAVFAVEQWLKQDGATLPPRLLKRRSVVAGAIFSFCCNGSINVIEFYLPTYLQAVRGFSPAQSGYMMLPLIIGSLVALLLQGTMVNIVGYFVPAMLLGSTMLPVAAGLMTTMTVRADLVKFLAISAFVGFAAGIGFQAPQVAVQNTLSEADSHMGLAIILFAQAFGPAVFVAAAQTIFTTRLTSNLHHIQPTLNATNIEKLGLSNLKDHLSGSTLKDVLLSLDQSLTQTWYLGVALACATMIGSASMEWKDVKK